MIKINKDPKTGLYYREGTYDMYVIREQRSYRKFFENIEGKKVLDIGGNIGAFAYNCLKYNPLEVISFEPEPENIKMFKMQKLGVILYEYAVTNKHGTIDLYTATTRNKGIHSVIKTKGRGIITVKTLSIEDVISFTTPDFVKIDIEGGEYLYDFNKIIPFVRGIAIEIHLQKQREMGKSLLTYLRDNFTELSNTNITEKNWHTLFIGVK